MTDLGPVTYVPPDPPCLKPCGPYYEPFGDFCGLPEGHDGDCDPTYNPRLPAFMREETSDG